MIYLSLTLVYFFQHSYLDVKAVANCSIAVVVMTPSKVFLMLSAFKLGPASFSFTFLYKKKSAGTRSGKYWGCLMCWMTWVANQTFIMTAVEMDALSL